ncbi:MAG: DUF2344 domain-containing protein [Planctomycetes bacterium]|nr:DUF2344 domain-containing protein [Planctomycetota bacterium]
MASQEALRETGIRLRFSRGSAQRFLSHLDLMRLFHRAFRRARLPLAGSRASVPRPRLRIPYPLPLGVESDCEILEAELEYPLRLEEVRARLDRCLPEDMAVRALRTLAPGERSVLVGLRYQVEGAGLPGDDRLRAFLAAPVWKADRRRAAGRVARDIRPLVAAVVRRAAYRLDLEFTVAEGRSARPDEVLGALGLDPAAIAELRIVRTGILEAEPPGAGDGRRGAPEDGAPEATGTRMARSRVQETSER